MGYEPKELDNWEHHYPLAAKRVTNVGSDLQTIVDEAGAPATTYVGKGARGLATASDGWFLKRIVVSGTTTTITHAIGSWNNRATATYS